MHKDALLTSRMRSRRDLVLNVSHLQMGCGPWQVKHVGVDCVAVNTYPRGAR